MYLKLFFFVKQKIILLCIRTMKGFPAANEKPKAHHLPMQDCAWRELTERPEAERREDLTLSGGGGGGGAEGRSRARQERHAVTGVHAKGRIGPVGQRRSR